MIKILLYVTFNSLLFSEYDRIYNGYGFDIGSNGSGVFVTRQYMHSTSNFSFNGELRFYDIKSSDETIAYDYSTGQYRSVGGNSLVMLPIFIGGNYYPFNEKIENNFSPMIVARFGGVISFDGKETGQFSQRWSNPDTQLTPGAFLGIGIDFSMENQRAVSATIGFELLPLKYEFDNMDNYSGGLIHISFNFRSK